MVNESKQDFELQSLVRLYNFIREELPGGKELMESRPDDISPADVAISLLRARVVAADVPVFVLKGTDILAAAAISYYTELCRSNGAVDQANEVEKALLEMREWQKANLSRVKTPVHRHVPHETQPLTIEPGHIKPESTKEKL